MKFSRNQRIGSILVLFLIIVFALLRGYIGS